MNIDDEIGRLLTIDRFVTGHCRDTSALASDRLAKFLESKRLQMLAGDIDDYALAAASRDAVSAKSEEKKSPSEDVRFVFLGEDWRADLVIPADADSTTELTVAITERKKVGIGSGLFTIAGVTLPVEGGVAKLPFGAFLTGMKDTNVSLTRQDGRQSRGALVFL